MHDPDGNMPRLIVLGLTGPVGSGCTTVSTLFDKPGKGRSQGNLFLKLLRGFDGAVSVEKSSEFSNTWEAINARVAKAYNERIPDCAECHDSGGEFEECESDRKQRHAELLEVLEERESLHGLRPLQDYYRPAWHLFRTLSVSDIIVFHAIMALQQRNWSFKGLPDAYARFAKIVVNHREFILWAFEESGFESFLTYYDEVRRQADQDVDHTKRLIGAVGWLHGLAGKIKDGFQRDVPKSYTRTLQDFGDNLRQCGDPFDNSGRKKNAENSYLLAEDVAQMIRLLYKGGVGAFFIIDCLRNPYEAAYLRHEFANFYLLSVFADERIRRQRVIERVRVLGEDNYDEKEIIESFTAAEERDSGAYIKDAAETLYKQNVPKCVEISDIAINNGISGGPEAQLFDLYKKVRRCICLILSPGCTKPSTDELFMNMAYTMAVKSNCVSRQVGAVIVSRENYVVGAGYNDVGEGRVSCGLRVIEDLRHENEFKALVEAISNGDESREELIERLCAQYGEPLSRQYCFCVKDEMVKKDAIPKLVKAWEDIIESAVFHNPQRKNDFLKLGLPLVTEMVEKGHLHQLEYCLALHAEENAIIQSARIGGSGLKGGTIYSTAQPCTLCGKKIQQVGLSEVVYSEPYPKSLSEVYMHGVVGRQFEGIKPRAYIRLFMPHHDQKEWQELESQGLNPHV